MSLDDAGAVFHTGGTTGAPKLARHLHRGMLHNAHLISKMVLGEGDGVLAALPLFHVFGCYTLALSALSAGARLVLLTPQGFRGEGVVANFWKLTARHRGAFLSATPTALAALERRPVDADISSLSYLVSGSAPLPQALFERFERKTGVRILEGYGLTETTCVAGCNPPHGPRKIGSVGLTLPYMRVRVAVFDDADRLLRDCGADEIGEVCYAGEAVFDGYEGVDAADPFFEEDGVRWLRTGDLGRVDADGYVWLTGRIKDVIIRSGRNIDPGVIEEALGAHPDVAQVAAVGQPDAYAGELPCAYVELTEHADASEETLRRFAQERVRDQGARPVAVVTLPELPKTSLGKIYKPELRRLAAERVLGAALTDAGIDDAHLRAVTDAQSCVACEVRCRDDEAPRVAVVLQDFATPWRRAP